MGQVKCCVSVSLSIIYLLLGIGYTGHSGRISPLVMAQGNHLHQPTDELKPEFLAPLTNSTVTQGRDVAFTCVVNNLGPYRVAWIKSDSKQILGIHTHMVSLNPRLSVTHNGHNTWMLHIAHVHLNDSGSYMCQVNTDPMKSISGYLDVVVPPDILNHPEHGLGDEGSCNEGGSVSLVCSATGVPQPTVQWRREDGRDIILRTESRDKQVVKVVDGEKLQLSNVQRSDMGSFLCIASNGVPPSVSKRFDVHVNFKPEAKAVNQLLGAPVEREVTLECIVEVYPKPLNGWYRNEGNLKLHSSSKYNISEAMINLYTWHLNLTIRHLTKSDFGAYSCSSSNALGKDEARIRLQELRLPPKPTTTATPYVPVTTVKPRRKQPTTPHYKGLNEVVRAKDTLYSGGQMQENDILSVMAAAAAAAGSSSGISAAGSSQGGAGMRGLEAGGGGAGIHTHAAVVGAAGSMNGAGRLPMGDNGYGYGFGYGQRGGGSDGYGADGGGGGGRGSALESYGVGLGNGEEVHTQLPGRNGAYDKSYKSPSSSSVSGGVGGGGMASGSVGGSSANGGGGERGNGVGNGGGLPATPRPPWVYATSSRASALPQMQFGIRRTATTTTSSLTVTNFLTFLYVALPLFKFISSELYATLTN